MQSVIGCLISWLIHNIHLLQHLYQWGFQSTLELYTPAPLRGCYMVSAWIHYTCVLSCPLSWSLGASFDFCNLPYYIFPKDIKGSMFWLIHHHPHSSFIIMFVNLVSSQICSFLHYFLTQNKHIPNNHTPAFHIPTFLSPKYLLNDWDQIKEITIKIISIIFS